MKDFFEYDVSNPQEHLERASHYPALSTFYNALSEELPPEEYEKLYEAEKQSFYSLTPTTSTSAKSRWIQ